MNSIVLGSSLSADWVEERMKRRGFAVHRPSQKLPLPAEPRAQERIKYELQTILSQAQAMPTAKEPGQDPWFLHPGTSAWAERPELHVVAQELGLIAILPPPRSLSRFGDKLALVLEAKRQGLPNLLSAEEAVSSVREAEQLIVRNHLRYPVVFKSVREWSGLGCFVVPDRETLRNTFPVWLEQLRFHFGEAVVFAEAYMESARQLMLPFARERSGEIHFFEPVDATLRKHHQKLLEFCPSPFLDQEPEALREITGIARRFLGDFVGVGALEFLLDGGRPFLVGGNARLTTSFPLWEPSSGMSAVDWQLRTLLGHDFGAELSPHRAHARRYGVAFRVYADDPILDLPQPGRIERVELPAEEMRNNGVTFSVRSERELSVDSDGLVLLGWTSGDTWPDALERTARAIKGIRIDGSLQTNERYLLEVLKHPWVKNGVFHASFLEEEFFPRLWPEDETIRRMVGLARHHVSHQGLDPSREWKWTVFYRPWKGRLEETDDSAPGPHESVFAAGPQRLIVRVDGWTAVVRWTQPEPAPKLCALTWGRVRFLHVAEGATAQPHLPVVTVESLRRLIPHSVGRAIRILRWKVEHGQLVEPGQELAEIDCSPTASVRT